MRDACGELSEDISALAGAGDDPRIAFFLRLVLGIVGLGGLIVATYVVAAEHNGTATAALVAASVVLLFLAAFGHRITSFKYGDVEVNVAATLLTQAREAGARGDVENEERLVGAALAAAGVSSGLSADISVRAKGRLHRDAVFNTLTSSFGALEYLGSPIDGIGTVGNSKIGIEAKSRPKRVAITVERIEKARKKKRLDIDGLLIVLRRHDKADLELLQEETTDQLGMPVKILRWRAQDPPDDLSEAVLELTRKLQPRG